MTGITEKQALDYFHQEVFPTKVVDAYKSEEALAKNLSGERATTVRSLAAAYRLLEGPKPNPHMLFSGSQPATAGFIPGGKPTVKPSK